MANVSGPPPAWNGTGAPKTLTKAECLAPIGTV